MARTFSAASAEHFLGDLPSALQQMNPFSVSLWFNGTTNSTDHCLFQSGRTDIADSYFRLGRVDNAGGANQIRFFCDETGGQGSADSSTSNAYSLNSWNHVVGIRAAVDNHRVVLNGDTANEGTTTSSVTFTDTAREIAIGYEADSTPGDGWNGQIAHVAVWDVALSTEDILALAAGLSPFFVRPGGLRFYAPLGAATGNAIDVVGGTTLVDTNTVTAGTSDPIISGGPVIFVPSVAAVGGYSKIPAVVRRRAY